MPELAADREDGDGQRRVGGEGDDAAAAFPGAFAADLLGLGDRAVGAELLGSDQQAFLVAVEHPQAAGAVLGAAGAQEEHALAVRGGGEGLRQTDGEALGSGGLDGIGV